MDSTNFIRRTPLIISLMFAASVVLLISNAVIYYQNQGSLVLANKRIAHTTGVLERLAELQGLATDAETGVRGYALTGEDTYLQPFLTARPLVTEKTIELKTWVADNREQRERLGRLERLIEARLIQLDAAVAFRRSKGPNVSPAIPNMDTAKANMDSIRATIREMVDEERRLFAVRQSIAQGWERSALISSVVMTGFGLLAFAIFYVLIGKYIQERHRAEIALADVNSSLENTVIARTTELSSLSRYLLTVREEEKAKIARELHDELGSSLTAINMDVTWVDERLKTRDFKTEQPDLAKRLERVRTLLGSTAEIKRRIIEDLRPSILDNLGLGAAIEAYANDFAQRTGIVVEQTLTDDLADLPNHCPIAVFRVFQESLTNVARHSRATRVIVMLDRRDEDLVLEVVDDGIGIGSRTGANTQSHGVLGMRERAQQLGGKFHIGPGAGGKGTLVRAIVPCPRNRS